MAWNITKIIKGPEDYKNIKEGEIVIVEANYPGQGLKPFVFKLKGSRLGGEMKIHSNHALSYLDYDKKALVEDEFKELDRSLLSGIFSYGNPLIKIITVIGIILTGGLVLIPLSLKKFNSHLTLEDKQKKALNKALLNHVFKYSNVYSELLGSLKNAQAKTELELCPEMQKHLLGEVTPEEKQKLYAEKAKKVNDSILSLTEPVREIRDGQVWHNTQKRQGNHSSEAVQNKYGKNKLGKSDADLIEKFYEANPDKFERAILRRRFAAAEQAQIG